MCAHGVFTATITLKNGKTTVKTNEVWRVSVSEGDVGGVVTGDRFEAWQSVWSLQGWRDLGTLIFGKNGTVMNLSGDDWQLGGGESVTLTIKSNGSVTAKGVFDTGTTNRQGQPVYYSATGSAVVCVTSSFLFAGQVFVYFPPNESKGFGGYVQVVPVGE